LSNLADRQSAPRIVRHSDELLRAIRDRIESVEAVAGLQLGYLTKITADPPPKRLQTWTMFLLCEALGLQVTLSVDPYFAERYAHRLDKRRLIRRVNKEAGRFGRLVLEAVPPDMRLVRNRRGGHNRMRRMTPAERSAFGKAAAMARWQNP